MDLSFKAYKQILVIQLIAPIYLFQSKTLQLFQDRHYCRKYRQFQLLPKFTFTQTIITHKIITNSDAC